LRPANKGVGGGGKSGGFEGMLEDKGGQSGKAKGKSLAVSHACRRHHGESGLSPCQRGPTNAFIIRLSVTAPIEETMPTYHVEMMEGRTIEQKKKLVAEITRVSVEILGGQPDSVDIIITDIKRENWATGGKLWSEPRS
jgi:4-oxalocrotonate tautomerase